MMKWRIRDIIDLEYFLHQDGVSLSADHQKHLHERDRNIFLKHVLPGFKNDKTPERKYIIKAWLERRREEGKAKSEVQFGAGFENLYGAFRLIFLVAGLILGGAAGLSFLTYTGDSPVNVFAYLSVFVFSQLLLLLLLPVLSLYRLFRKSFLPTSPLYALISGFILRTALSAKRLSAEQRLQAESFLGIIVGKTRTYGFLFFLPIFILTQLFALGFNLGLLAATLFKVVTADIAFGWQSTIQLSPETVYPLVQKIARPWSWAVPGDMAFPSLSQIEGSRIILKEGIHHLATPNLVSWWPFLCLAVLTYGLLPRLLLFLGAVSALRKYLGSLDFRQGIHEQLLLRMTTPLVSTRGRLVDDAAAREKEPAPAHPASNFSASAGRNLLVMIPDEISVSCSREEIESVLNREDADSTPEIIRFNQEYASARELLASLRDRDRLAATDILIIQEAWQPPILEYIDFIRQLRMTVGDSPCIRIGLIGKPRPDTIFTPANEEHRKIWRQKITALGDPCISAEGLIPHAP